MAVRVWLFTPRGLPVMVVDPAAAAAVARRLEGLPPVPRLYGHLPPTVAGPTVTLDPSGVALEVGDRPLLRLSAPAEWAAAARRHRRVALYVASGLPVAEDTPDRDVADAVDRQAAAGRVTGALVAVVGGRLPLLTRPAAAGPDRPPPASGGRTAPP